MLATYRKAFVFNFLGSSATWYKLTIMAFLLLNPLLLFVCGPFITGWTLILEFIFTLAMILQCHPLASGGLLALEALALGMTSPAAVLHEVESNLEVLLMLMFMVAGIHFMKEGLRLAFTTLLLRVRSKMLLSLIFCVIASLLSAFLDALTMIAVIITVASSFYMVYFDYIQSLPLSERADKVPEGDAFKAFLRNIMMHGAVGTVFGGTLTLVGEPQNIFIAQLMGWNFMEYLRIYAVISVPALLACYLTCFFVEWTKILGFGKPLPESVRALLKARADKQMEGMDIRAWARMIVQSLVGVYLISALALHIAPVGFIGLSVMVLLTAFLGVTEEHKFGEAFTEAMPFASLLVVFFSIVAVIHEQQLFTPLIASVLKLEGEVQLLAFFAANGILSTMSDSVFVATVFISEVEKAFNAGAFDREWYEKLAVVVNTATNIPAVATPNGQPAFLFLLTSSLASVIRLSYLEMVKMALPFLVSTSTVAVISIMYFL
ncbi:MAG: sodium/proton antiporter NhaB [Deltaproteobacteria bacterium]|jgi:NhaB family Na+:H+ antiporter|nr:sodium/proton antiporter NhaB [Deltaproteobacteria bacterium]